MPTVFTPANLSPCQVDDFGADVERSHKGALHFRPSTMVTLTEGELKHLKAKHKKLAESLHILPEPSAPKMEIAKAEPVEAKAEVVEVKPDPVEAKPEEAAEESATPEPVEAATEQQPRHKKQKQKW